MTTPNDPATTEPAKPEGAPETYAAFKAPEGRELSKSFLDKATPIFRELNLSQAAAQKLVDTYNELTKDSEDLAVKAVGQMREGWRQDFMKSDLGGKLDAVKADIGRMKDVVFADDRSGREAFEKALDLTGAGDHPALISGFYKMAQAFTEGKHVSGNGASPEGQKAPGQTSRPSLAQAMYPSLSQ